MSNYKIVHYINQFYAGIGGEEKANTEPFKKMALLDRDKPSMVLSVVQLTL